jgi:hypothetical protein
MLSVSRILILVFRLMVILNPELRMHGLSINTRVFHIPFLHTYGRYSARAEVGTFFKFLFVSAFPSTVTHFVRKVIDLSKYCHEIPFPIILGLHANLIIADESVLADVLEEASHEGPKAGMTE